jgi:Protein of unknown function (DUF3604)
MQQPDRQGVYLYALKLLAGEKIQALLSPEVAHTVWEKNIEFANKANEPGKLTAFCSYEWTSMPNNMNLHRNLRLQARRLSSTRSAQW